MYRYEYEYVRYSKETPPRVFVFTCIYNSTLQSYAPSMNPDITRRRLHSSLQRISRRYTAEGGRELFCSRCTRLLICVSRAHLDHGDFSFRVVISLRRPAVAYLLTWPSQSLNTPGGSWVGRLLCACIPIWRGMRCDMLSRFFFFFCVAGDRLL